MACENPIFIVGTERSGSNLLRLILNAHSQVTVPHPPHILNYFGPLEPSYGDLSRDENLRVLARDVLSLIRVHIHPWEFEVETEAVVGDANPRSLFGVFIAIYEQYRAWSGKPRWGCKSTFMIHDTGPIFERYSGARLIWLVRDPRDVAASSRKSVFSPFHPYLTASLWRDQQALGFEVRDRLGIDRLHLVRYEDLLTDSEKVVRELCAFIGEDFEPAMLRYAETDDARRIAALSESWRNSATPIITGNTGKYQSELTREETRTVEGVTRRQMLQLGYALDHPEAREPHPGRIRKLFIQVRDLAWRTKVEFRSLGHDPNHWRRWKRGALVRSLRRKARRRLRSRSHIIN